MAGCWLARHQDSIDSVLQFASRMTRNDAQMMRNETHCVLAAERIMRARWCLRGDSGRGRRGRDTRAPRMGMAVARVWPLGLGGVGK